jgi:hypothetical protein
VGIQIKHLKSALPPKFQGGSEEYPSLSGHLKSGLPGFNVDLKSGSNTTDDKGECI